jgi:hypothetical protein
MKKKRVNEGLRSISKNFVNEKELEENIKSEISNEIYTNRKKS